MSSDKIPPKEEQKKIIQKLISEKSVPTAIGEKWYVVIREWMKNLKYYVGIDPLPTGVETVLNPGKIVNNELLVASSRLSGETEFKKLIRFLTQTDYILLNEKLFDKLKEWYGCDHSILRYSINHRHLEVEVYPLMMVLKYQKEESKSEEFLDLSAFEMKEFVSSAHKLFKTFYEEVGKLFNLEKDSYNLWLGHNNRPYRILNYSRFCNIRLREIIRRVYEQEIFIFKKETKSEQNRTPVKFDIPNKETPISSIYRNKPNELRGGTPPKEIPTFCGLKDLGNSCYMSASLQCLVRLKLLHPYFMQQEYARDINKTNPLGMGGKMARAFSRVMKQMWAKKYGYLFPREIKYVIQRFNPRFEGNRQQDVSEFTMDVLSLLHEDLKTDRKISMSPLDEKIMVSESDPFAPRNLNKIREEEECGEDGDSILSPMLPLRMNPQTACDEDKSWAHYFNHDGTSIINTTFYGQSKSVRTCMNCKVSSTNFAPFDRIRMPVPDPGTAYTFKFHYYQNRKTPQQITLRGMQPGKGMGVDEMISHVAEYLQLNPSSLVILGLEKGRNRVLKNRDLIDIQNNQHIVIHEIPEHVRVEMTGKGRFVKVSVLAVGTGQGQGKSSSSTSSLEPISPFLVWVTPKSTIREVFQQCCDFIWHYVDRSVKDLFPNPVANDHFGEDVINTGYDTSSDDLFELVLMNDAMTRLDFKDKNTVFSTVDEKLFHDGVRKGVILDISEKSLRVSYDRSRFSLYSKRVKYIGTARLTLKSLMENYCRESEMVKHCGKCGNNQLTVERNEFWRLPKILIVQLMRFNFEDTNVGGKVEKRAVKIQEKVEFPLDDFRAGQFSPNPTQKNKVYKLRGLCDHHGGTINFGHYTACVRFEDENGTRWVRANNEKFEVMKDTKEVVSEKAYLLFFELQENKKK